MQQIQKGFGLYHVRPFRWKLGSAVVSDGVEHAVLHKNANSSTNEGGEEVNVDVIACAVETSVEKKHFSDKKRRRKKI